CGNGYAYLCVQERFIDPDLDARIKNIEIDFNSRLRQRGIEYIESNAIVLGNLNVPDYVKFITNFGPKFSYKVENNEINQIEMITCLNNIRDMIDNYEAWREFSIFIKDFSPFNREFEFNLKFTKTQKFFKLQFYRTRKFLRENQNIIISSADKGGKVVITDKKTYEQKIDLFIDGCIRQKIFFKLDSLQLDNDIARIIRDQLTKSLHNLSPGQFTNYQLELDLFLRSAIWYYSIGCSISTFGQQLLFICYDENQLTKSKLLLHYIVNVLFKYVKDYANYRYANSRNLQTCTVWIDNALTFCTLLNFFRFLKTGKKPSLADYILGLDNISMYGNKRRDVGYTHMTRELIWGGFMELLGFTIPLINYHAVKRKLRNLASFSRKNLSVQSEQNPPLTVITKCAFCKERPTLPHHMGCSHIFCYYCLQGNLIADDKFQCPICDFNGSFQALIF
ncbi:Peroxisome biogenesis factor 2, partial [Pseudolycoriella hygida]